MRIADREIGPGQPPYIVAELGAGHHGNIHRAKDLILSASDAGADAVKFQCYLPELVSVNCDGKHHRIKGTQWDGRKLFDLYKEVHTPREWLPVLFDYAAQVGITAFSSVVTPEDVAFLEELGSCPAYKLPSLDIRNFETIEAMAATEKLVIISTMMANSAEVKDAWRSANYSNDVLFMHCSDYGARAEEAGLDRIDKLKCICGPVGYSDHTRGYQSVMLAVARGAVMIEKHIALSDDSEGPDDSFAESPLMFEQMVRWAHRAYKAFHPVETPKENPLKKLRPSLHAVIDIREGEPFTAKNIRVVRPSGGLEPGQRKEIIGKVARTSVSRGTPITLELVA